MAWLLPISDARKFARGTAGGLTYLSWYAEATGSRVIGIESDFDHYRLDNVIAKIIEDAESADAEVDSDSAIVEGDS